MLVQLSQNLQVLRAVMSELETVKWRTFGARGTWHYIQGTSDLPSRLGTPHQQIVKHLLLKKYHRRLHPTLQAHSSRQLWRALRDSWLVSDLQKYPDVVHDFRMKILTACNNPVIFA